MRVFEVTKISKKVDSAVGRSKVQIYIDLGFPLETHVRFFENKTTKTYFVCQNDCQSRNWTLNRTQFLKCVLLYCSFQTKHRYLEKWMDFPSGVFRRKTSRNLVSKIQMLFAFCLSRSLFQSERRGDFWESSDKLDKLWWRTSVYGGLKRQRANWNRYDLFFLNIKVALQSYSKVDN